MDTEVFQQTNIIKDINTIIMSCGEPLEGNCLYSHRSNFRIRKNSEDLRQNLFQIAKNSNSILEIGFNGGHSAALYFYANPNLKLLSFDICSHQYTEPVYSYLKNLYNVELVKGDSRDTLPTQKIVQQYDVIHIDGGHGIQCAKSDLMFSQIYAHEDTLIIMDDANFKHIHKLLEEQILLQVIQEIDYHQYHLTPTKYHRIFKLL